MERTVELLRAEATPLTGGPEDLDRALALIDPSVRVVLIGEATHGTHEFYRLRNELTKRLIVEHGFHGVVVEAEWPAAYQVNKYVRGAGRARTATEALSGFKAFPQWLWRNADVLDFVGWLRLHNASLMEPPTQHPEPSADPPSQGPQGPQGQGQGEGQGQGQGQGHGQGQGRQPAVGFYGMDLYSLYPSISAVLSFLKRMGQHDLYEQARTRYADFFRFSEGDPHLYGATATCLGSCERQALDELHDMIQLSTQLRRREDNNQAGKPRDRDRAASGSGGGGGAESPSSSSDDEQLPSVDSDSDDDVIDKMDAWALEPDDGFVAEQNARVVASAEAYYRTVFGREEQSWNVRDRHMADTVAALLDHIAGQLHGRAPAPLDHIAGQLHGRAPAPLDHIANQLHGPAPATQPTIAATRLVVWAHNSHVGDARATAMCDHGEVSVGQLCRERFGADAVRIFGFATSTGTVTAAPQWDAPAHVMALHPPQPGAWEDVLHQVGLPKLFLDCHRASPVLRAELARPRLQRAIGVVYGGRAATEFGAHCYTAQLADQFDALFYFDRTRAVEPLEPTADVFTDAEDLLAGL